MDAALVATLAALEIEVDRQLRREKRPDRQRRLLALYRHGRALRLAIDHWLDVSNTE